jgi:hypothetical protein
MLFYVYFVVTSVDFLVVIYFLFSWWKNWVCYLIRVMMGVLMWDGIFSV